MAVCRKVSKVQSIYGSYVLFEEHNAIDVTSGYKVTSVRFSSCVKWTMSSWFTLVLSMAVPSYLLMMINIADLQQKGILMVFLIAFPIVFNLWFHSDSTESVLAIGNVGVQITRKQGWWSGRGSSRFIPLSAIYDVIVNEAIYRHRVIFYLAILVRKDGENEDTTDIIPLFTSQMPRLDSISTAYKALKLTLKPSNSIENET